VPASPPPLGDRARPFPPTRDHGPPWTLWSPSRPRSFARQRKPRPGCDWGGPCGKSAARRRSKSPRAVETLGTFTPRYKMSFGAVKPCSPQGFCSDAADVTPGADPAVPTVLRQLSETGGKRDARAPEISSARILRPSRRGVGAGAGCSSPVGVLLLPRQALERRPVLLLTARCRSMRFIKPISAAGGVVPHFDLSDDEAAAQGLCATARQFVQW
jgi:hypothetical protein